MKNYINVVFILLLIVPACSRQKKMNLFENSDNDKIASVDTHSRFYVPVKSEWRCDTHPRSTPDGNFVIVDAPNWDGRQMYMLDIRDVK
jgi:hypothetical protein